jgi:hypothetical protein
MPTGRVKRFNGPRSQAKDAGRGVIIEERPHSRSVYRLNRGVAHGQGF